MCTVLYYTLYFKILKKEIFIQESVDRDNNTSVDLWWSNKHPRTQGNYRYKTIWWQCSALKNFIYPEVISWCVVEKEKCRN